MDFEAARIKMVDNQVRTTDVTDARILGAFLTVPREIFVPAERQVLAYIDGDLPLGGGRFLMEPSPFAKLLQLARVGAEDRVLDVGCGTGYSAAVLSRLAGSVVALEEEESLAKAAGDTLSAAEYANCTVVRGPLVAGHAPGAPYDLIVFEGAVETLPPAFFDQLANGGRLVVVEGTGNAAAAKLYLKEPGGISGRFGFNCAIRPLPGFERAAEFVF